ncbi:MAG: Fe-S cluster assembly protein SufD [Bacteroidales bacterium]|nr:Fe-S cluster assembly protein SufD [Bacteroidales bacterium]
MARNEMKCECFACNIPALDTLRLEVINGKSLNEFSVIPDKLKGLVELRCSDKENTIIVKDNTIIDKPLQIINLMDGSKTETESNTTVVLGENAQATLLYCDDSLPKGECSANHKLNIRLKDSSCFAFYKLENVNNNTSINSNVIFSLEKESKLSSFFISLNGGKLKNTIEVNFTKDYAEADINGLYLMDREQSIDNNVKIIHKTNNCKSNQLFKGILDDEAKANFVGHILVDYDAKNNIATQTNNNILLTDKAKVNTQPVLEIYNDDVQCSHGATTGQLDEMALYYLRSRGISERTAKMLLLKAFCHSVLQKSNITELKESFNNMVEKRLNGGLSFDLPFKIEKL